MSILDSYEIQITVYETVENFTFFGTSTVVVLW